MGSQDTYGAALVDAAGATAPQARLSSTIKTAVLSGAAANTNIALSGLHPNRDELISVIENRAGLVFNYQGGSGAGTQTVTGIVTTDRLVSVLEFSTTIDIATVTDRTSDFTITAANTITNGGVAIDAGNSILVIYEDTSTSGIDRTSISRITSNGNIRLSSATTGSVLLVTYGSRGAF